MMVSSKKVSGKGSEWLPFHETLKPQVEGSETPDAGGEAEEGLAKHRAATLVRYAPYAREGAVSW